MSQEIINSISFSSLKSPTNWEVESSFISFTVGTISLIFLTLTLNGIGSVLNIILKPILKCVNKHIWQYLHSGVDYEHLILIYCHLILNLELAFIFFLLFSATETLPVVNRLEKNP